MTNDAAGRAGSTGPAEIGGPDHGLYKIPKPTAVIWGAPVPTVRTDGFDTRNLKARREDAVKEKKKAFTVGSYAKVPDSLNDPAVFTMNAVKIADEIVKIVASKQKDYGPNNIQASPFGPIKGLTVRLYDKIARLANLSDTAKEPEHESLRDTLIDIAGYGIIGLMLLDGTFPKEK